MNIAQTETSMKITAKTCGCKEKKITYSFLKTYHSLCIDKGYIISAVAARFLATSSSAKS